MAELAFRLKWKIRLVDWSLNCPRFYDIEPIQNAFYSSPVSFGGKIFQQILVKFKESELPTLKNSQ